MQIMYFSERPYIGVPEEEIIKRRSFFGLPNNFYDRERGSQLLNEYIDEKVYAEELGFDAVSLNEHHGTPFCMTPVMNVEASVLARATKSIKIVLLGNPLPVIGNPLRLAEELAMIDSISKGRLVSGWIRGTGCESVFNSVPGVYNRELFNEAHELILKAWTQTGPFRFEGKHFHYRFIDPWVLPLQKPHPQIWIPGIISPESVVWAAKRRYPYIALGTATEATAELWNLYTKTAGEQGFQAGPECFGFMQKVFVAESEAKAEELGRADMFAGNWNNYGRQEWMAPPGYNSKETLRRFAAGSPLIPLSQVPETASVEEAKKQYYNVSYQDAVDRGFLIVGTPKTVIPKLQRLLRVLKPGALGLCQNDGPIGREARLTSMRLLAEEVLPALRETAREVGIVDSFERTPGSRQLPASGKPDSVVDREAMAAA
jgi:alkanesulfonate monooxygenase SsuD/methylene tetrahydromethanopterin reductase-like flavin-dependent oxidoreductase (luciferase family)